VQLSPDERALLAPYVTSLDSPVFALKNLPEEVVAVLFAYYSRSRESLRTNLLKLIQDRDLDVAGTAAADASDEEELAQARKKAKEFHEKWVVGYGHASVAEHAVAHIAIEEVSIVASKVIEDARLAAYTEKSTRYVPFGRVFYGAPELTGEAETADRSQFKTDRGFQNSCQAQACDALRYLLPAATHTNIGLTANARTLEHLISKLLSHPLPEVQEVGERIRVEATKLIPTLIKYARVKEYWAETAPAMRALTDGLLGTPEDTPAPTGAEVVIVQAPEEAEARLAAAILYEFTDQPYDVVLARVRTLSSEEHRRVIEEYLARRKTYGTAPHTYTDPPLRSLEHLYFTFDVLVDYGAYRDIQRHRMATQTTQRLTCAHGYDAPDLIEAYGFGADFRAAMDRAAAAHGQLAAAYPEEAQYLVPLAYRKRVLFTWNLRALHHFVSLRSARQGHLSYRRIAQAVWRELDRTHPFLAQFINVDMDDYEMARPG
jgi:thymidylate synthase ThyX